MALSDYQVSFGGVTMGAGTEYRITTLKGIRDMPPIQTNDTPLLTADGVFSGYDTLLARIIEATVIVTGTSGSDFETNLAALEAAMVPILNGTSSLHWKMPNAVEKKIEARPRKIENTILPTYRKLWTQVDLMWSCPAPAIVNA